jgi:multicomponent Na+:H+ antiporter subunit A
LAVGLVPALPQLLQASYSPISPLGLAGCLLALAGGVAAAFLPGRLTLLAALGACGLGLALVFVSVNAPDVAMTQLMVETLSLIFLALVFRKMPTVPASGARAPWKRRLHASVAILFGLSVTGALLLAVSLPLPGEIAQWYQANSLPGGHGHNVVNVILVDFRAFDTLGEILVVALSALAAASLLGTGRRFGNEHSGEDAFTSPLLRQGLRPLAWLMLAASLLVLWRGHNLPGGGFIGGLVAACGLILLVLTYGHGQIRRVLPIAPAQLIGIGLGCAAGAGILGLIAGNAFLTGLWTFPGGLPLGTPLLFDVGVFLTVFGSAMHMIDKLTGVRQ